MTERAYLASTGMTSRAAGDAARPEPDPPGDSWQISPVSTGPKGHPFDDAGRRYDDE
jgi:hypothetical protein